MNILALNAIEKKMSIPLVKAKPMTIEKPFLNTKIISKTTFYKYPTHWLNHSLWTSINPNSNYIQLAVELDQQNIPWKRSSKSMNHFQIIPSHNLKKWSDEQVQVIHQLVHKYGYHISQELVNKNYTTNTVSPNSGLRLIAPVSKD